MQDTWHHKQIPLKNLSLELLMTSERSPPVSHRKTPSIGLTSGLDALHNYTLYLVEVANPKCKKLIRQV